MNKEKVILIGSWIVTSIFLKLFIPKDKIREAHLSFLVKQVITWLFGLIVVERGLIKYPVRLFRKANKTSFTFEYFVYPALCAIYNANYPKNNHIIIKTLYTLLYPTFITILEYILVKYTRLIKYTNWKWYYTFITLLISDRTSRIYHDWFFKDEITKRNKESS